MVYYNRAGDDQCYPDSRSNLVCRKEEEVFGNLRERTIADILGVDCLRDPTAYSCGSGRHKAAQWFLNVDEYNTTSLVEEKNMLVSI